MRRIFWQACLLVASCLSLVSAADRTPGPLPPEEAAAAMILAPGFRANVFAAEPDVVQPVSFCIDDRGRLIVAEALNYGEWKPTGQDRIVILEDSDGDGRADSRKLFYEGLNYVTGIEVGFGGVYVMSPPSLYFIPDRDGDDKPDGPPEVLFDGFGHKESRHNLANGFTWGPDGWLYAGHGRTSPSDVGRPGTPAEQRIHCDGGVYRIHPTRLVFENFADGTTNPWGVDFDDYGQCFVSNCVNPHLFHMIQGGHYEPWRGRPSSQYAYERLPTIADHLHFPANKPSAMRGETDEVLAMGGGHAHCGTLIYLGDMFPERYRNTAFMCNVHGRRINNDILKRKGSGYTASHGPDFMISADPWFMGVTLRTGPDGSLFVSDWSDTGECHTYKPMTATGRIYRISYGEPKPRPPVNIAKLSDAELVELQQHRNDWYVRHARRNLQERSAAPGWKSFDVHAALRAQVRNFQLDEPRRLRALWALWVTAGIDDNELVIRFNDPSAYVRAWSIRFLFETPKPPRVLEEFRKFDARVPSLVERLEWASALQRMPRSEEHFWLAAELMSEIDSASDANLPLMIWYGIEAQLAGEDRDLYRLAILQNCRVPLIREFAGRRIFDDALLNKRIHEVGPVLEFLTKSDPDVQKDLLKGAQEALRGQRNLPMPDEWPTAYSKLSQSESAEVREGAIVVALTFGDPKAVADLKKTVSTSDSRESRRAALQTLIDHQVPELAAFLHEHLNDSVLQDLALRGLARYDHPQNAPLILAIYPRLAPSHKQDALATLAARKASAEALLTSMESKAIPASDVSAYVARQLHALGDQALSERLRKLWGDVRDTAPERQKQIARLKDQLSPTALATADLRNGRMVYSKTCQNCHKLYGEGGTIGPDLTGSNRSNLDYLLSNIIDPSAEIGRDYRMSLLQLADGRTLTGMILERTPARVALQTATEKLVIPAGDIEDTKDSALSMMPEGQLNTLVERRCPRPDWVSGRKKPGGVVPHAEQVTNQVAQVFLFDVGIEIDSFSVHPLCPLCLCGSKNL